MIDAELPPPILERSVPLQEIAMIDADLAPPVLERSVPIEAMDVTVVPSTIDDSEMSSSFDISHRDIDDTLPIEEE